MIGFMTDLSQIPESLRKNLLIKEYLLTDLGINSDEINISRFKWEGDYDSGRLVDIVKENRTIVTEQEINTKFDSMFYEKYPPLDIIKEILLSVQLNTPKGRDIQIFLEKVLTKKLAAIEFYKASPNHIWETKEKAREREKNAFK